VKIKKIIIKLFANHVTEKKGIKSKMAKGRLLNKVIILSRKLNTISEGAENLYYRLLVISDDFGRYHADPEIIKGQIYTLRKIKTPTIKQRLQELDDIKLIKIYNSNGEKYLEIVNFEKNQYFRKDFNRKDDFPSFQQGSRDESVQVCTGSDGLSTQHYININRNSNENINTIEKIITHLNEKAKTNYSPKTKITTEYINGRIADGFKLDDFFHVIDVKCEDWIGDLEMEKFLRPKTLFATSNFEGYLNQKRERSDESWADRADKREQEEKEKQNE